MSDPSSPSKLSLTRLILVPALITLAVTLLRLIGELMHWSSILFNRSAGGGGAIVGVTWLPFIFGPYFAVKLWDRGEGPAGSGKTIAYAVSGIVIFILGGYLAFAAGAFAPSRALVGLLLMVIAPALLFIPWRALAKTLLAYAYAARIPVAIVMFFAIRGNWGTHYDATPPEPVPAGFWSRYFYVALVPQLVMWIGYTMIVGALVGAIYVAIFRRKKPATVPDSQQAAGA